MINNITQLQKKEYFIESFEDFLQNKNIIKINESEYLNIYNDEYEEALLDIHEMIEENESLEYIYETIEDYLYEEESNGGYEGALVDILEMIEESESLEYIYESIEYYMDENILYEVEMMGSNATSGKGINFSSLNPFSNQNKRKRDFKAAEKETKKPSGQSVVNYKEKQFGNTKGFDREAARAKIQARKKAAEDQELKIQSKAQSERDAVARMQKGANANNNSGRERIGAKIAANKQAKVQARREEIARRREGKEGQTMRDNYANKQKNNKQNTDKQNMSFGKKAGIAGGIALGGAGIAYGIKKLRDRAKAKKAATAAQNQLPQRENFNV